MRLFDLHCDTLTEIYLKKENILSNSCNISLDLTEKFDSFVQVLAVWSNPKFTDDELYSRFFDTINHFKSTSFPLPENFGYIFALEGGNLIGNDISRIDTLYECGVRIFTPVWSDLTQIGGAFNTDKGLTDLGKNAVKRCFDLGIIPDVSHSSDKGFFDIYELSQECQKPFIASHSNSRSVCQHKRNLTDEMAEIIIKNGGLIGISMYSPHLSENENPTIDDIYRHVEHYLSLGGENTLAFGGDLDGTGDVMPEGIRRINDFEKIYSYLIKKLPESTVNKITFENAHRFFERNGVTIQK
jgi:membrane dipeptidase